MRFFRRRRSTPQWLSLIGPWCLATLVLLLAPRVAKAQLATSFYNVTGIETKTLPNAVQVRIKTDGTVYFGAVQTDFINWFNAYEPKPTTSVRLRVLGARSKLPALVNIGTYPVDSAQVSIAPADFPDGFFRWEAPEWEPHVDITLRFFVPVKIKRLVVKPGDWGIRFGSILNANEGSIEIGQDQQSIVLTIVPDRVDKRSDEKIKRSPAEGWKRSLQVDAVEEGRFSVQALHTPLREVLDVVGLKTNTPLLAAADAAETDVSLRLPDTDIATFINALTNGYGLNAVRRDDGGVLFTRAVFDASPSATRFDVPINGAQPLQSVTLKYLSPDNARTLFPDFLLPSLRADRENNALLFSASPEIGDKIRAALAILDQPRAQVRIEAQAWEISSSDEANRAISLALGRGDARIGLDTAGAVAVRLDNDVEKELTARLELLKEKSLARLQAKPFLVALSGERGSLFLGQNRYVRVLQGNGDSNEVKALNLQIGTTLNVTPRVGASGDITLDLNPRFSTVDEIETGTGLPTLGIREANAVVRVRDGEQVLVAGLDADLSFDNTGRTPILPKSKRHNKDQTSMLVLVSARRLDAVEQLEATKQALNEQLKAEGDLPAAESKP